MNRIRRSEINKIIRQATDLLERIDNLISEEEESRDNMPESLQESERAGMSDNAIDELTEASDLIDEVIDHLNDAKG